MDHILTKTQLILILKNEPLSNILYATLATVRTTR